MLKRAYCRNTKQQQRQNEEPFHLHLRKSSPQITPITLKKSAIGNRQSAMTSLIPPLRNSPRCPRCACCLQLFLQPRQVDFDQLAQLAQHGFEVLRRSSVLIVLSLSWTRA